MKKLASVFIPFFALILFSSPFGAKPVCAAQEAWFFHSFESFFEVINNRADANNELQQEGYGFSFFTNQIYSLSGLIIGGSTDPSKAMYYKKSALANVGSAMAFMYQTPPASTYAFVRDLGQTLGFMPKSAYAQQGIGFSGLQPLLPVWKAFRNVAYLLLAVIMVVIGFMVMFRRKIDPKTVVTVQNALPRVVVTLLLITFSYAIVGLMIDLMYLLTALGISLIGSSTSGGIETAGGIQLLSMKDYGNWLLNQGFIGFTISAFSPLVKQAIYVAGAPIQSFFSTIQQIQSAGSILDVAGIIGKGIFSFTTALGSSFSIGPMFILLLSLAYLFSFVRIFFILLSAYINIIMSLIIGPIQILFDAIPGGNNFSSWIKNLISNIIPFPITILMFMIGITLTQPDGKMWVPPFLPQREYMGDLTTSIIWLGLILVIPNVINGIKEALKTKPAIPVGMGALTGPVTGTVQTVMGTASQFYYGSQLIGGAKKLFTKEK